MTRRPSRNVARKQELRMEQILQAAGEVFVEKGYFAATTRDIADQVRIQPGSLYYYIDSKESALLEICRRVGREFNANMRALLDRRAPVAELVREGMVTHMLNNRAHLVYHFVHSPRELPPAVRRDLNRMARAYQAQWETLLKRGARDGSLRRDLDPGTAAVALLALCNGSVEWYQGKPRADVKDLANAFANLFLRGAMPDRQPGRPRPGP